MVTKNGEKVTAVFLGIRKKVKFLSFFLFTRDSSFIPCSRVDHQEND